MPPRAWQVRVEDMLDAIARVQRYTDGMTFEQFAADDRTVDAVIRNLGVIDEAARHIPPEIAESYPDSAWDEMRGLRNFVIHQYSEVSLAIIWETVQRDLPDLIPRLVALRDEPEQSS